MDKVTALHTLANLANLALTNSLYKDINEAGVVYSALITLAQDIPREELENKQETLDGSSTESK